MSVNEQVFIRHLLYALCTPRKVGRYIQAPYWLATRTSKATAHLPLRGRSGLCCACLVRALLLPRDTGGPEWPGNPQEGSLSEIKII